MSLFDPAMVPFTSALVLMGMLVVAEILGAVIGVMPSSALDSILPDFDGLDADGDAGLDGTESAGVLGQFFSWLSVGRVPVLVLLMIFLAAFGLVGIGLQNIWQSIAGTPAPLGAAMPLALIGALYPTRFFGRVIGHALPAGESEASSAEDFVGLPATITIGNATRILPAEARLIDDFGQSHQVRVVPNADITLPQGTRITLLDWNGATYTAVAETEE